MVDNFVYCFFLHMNITFVAKSAAFLHYLNVLAPPTGILEASDVWYVAGTQMVYSHNVCRGGFL